MGKYSREVSLRIESEKKYHDEIHYAADGIEPGLSFDLATCPTRRPHNLTWSCFDAIIGHFSGNVAGKRFLVVGCGTGNFALNLAKAGARIDAFDVSERAVEICKRRAEYHGIGGTNFFVSSCEDLDVPGEAYDAVVGELVLHHIDIPIAVEQFHRALVPGGMGFFMEWKEYPVVDRIRSIAILRKLFPPGGRQRYATEFERKLTRGDFEAIRGRFPHTRLEYRYCIRGKVDYFWPSLGDGLEKFDYMILKAFPALSYFTDGVIIIFQKS